MRSILVVLGVAALEASAGTLSSLPLGRYTLTHFDGVETLQAEI